MNQQTEQGRHIVAVARQWVGTPYQHQASLRGVGCDCLGLVRGIWRAVIGPEPETVPAYGSHWAETSGAERLLGAATRHFLPLNPQLRLPGDVLLFRMKPRAVAKHVGILAMRDGVETLIHAYEGNSVVEGALVPFWQARIAGTFRFPAPKPS